METTTEASLAAIYEYLAPRASADHVAYNCPAIHLRALALALRDEQAYDLLLDVTGIDWDAATPRFTGVYHFYSTSRHVYLRIAVDCLDNVNPTLPTLADIYPAANWHERETYDMLGIVYEGHPDLRRILMWDDYPYFPLRKDFPLAGIETELPAADVAESTQAKVKSAPMMGGPFVSKRTGPMSEAEPRALDESWTEHSEKPFTATVAKE
jgi:NADH-quinone oxidoreductase subunit C